MTPSQYVTALQVHVMDQLLRLKNEYDDKQQSKEMLYRAALNYNQPIATKLSNELSILLNTSATLPEEWHIEGFADKFYDFPNIKSSSISSPGINLFN